MSADSPHTCLCAVRAWVVQTARALVDLARTKRGHERTEDDCRLLLSFCRLLIEMGQKREARTLCIEGLQLGGLDVVLDDSNGQPTGDFRASVGGVLDAEHEVVLKLKDALSSTGPMGSAVRKDALQRELCAIWERTHGPESKEALHASGQLALHLLSWGETMPGMEAKSMEAKELYGQLLPNMERVMGPNHRETLDAKSYYARLLCRCEEITNLREGKSDLTQRKAARLIYSEVVEGCEATLGPRHPSTLTARSNLAHTLNQLGEVERAKEEYEAVMQSEIVQEGADHSNTLITMHLLAQLKAEKLGDYDGAVELMRHCTERAGQNPNIGESQTADFAAALGEYQARVAMVAAGERVVPQSSWAKLTLGARALYHNLETDAESLDAPKEGFSMAMEHPSRHAFEHSWMRLMNIGIALLADGTPVSCTFGFGQVSDLDYTGEIVATEPPCAESALVNASELKGKVALMFRMVGAVASGANRAAEAGAVAVVVISDTPGDVPCTPGDSKNLYQGSIPVLGVSGNVGSQLAAATHCRLGIGASFGVS